MLSLMRPSHLLTLEKENTMTYLANPLYDARPTDDEMLANLPWHAISIEWNLTGEEN